MKPWDMVSSFRGANTLFQGQQNKSKTDRRENTEKRETEERTQKTDHRRQINR
jgi:hypothetical protein